MNLFDQIHPSSSGESIAAMYACGMLTASLESTNITQNRLLVDQLKEVQLFTGWSKQIQNSNDVQAFVWDTHKGTEA